jgi:hypothetical protein
MYLGSLDGWIWLSEVTFSHYGERGIIDILAWHPPTRSLLVIELKTELVDPQKLVAVMHRRVRLGRQIAAREGWDRGPSVPGSSYVTPRPSVAAHDATVGSWEAPSRMMVERRVAGCGDHRAPCRRSRSGHMVPQGAQARRSAESDASTPADRHGRSRSQA